VTKGDLTRSIQVEAQGEVAFVKDNINEMIRNLRDTTLRNKEQDCSRRTSQNSRVCCRDRRDFLTVGKLILSEVAPLFQLSKALST